MSATLRGYDWARDIVRGPSTLKAKARAVAWVVADHAGADGHCHLLQETIAREAGWSDRAVRQGIAELCAAGLLEASRTRGASRFTLLQTGTTCRTQPDETGTTCRTEPPETGTACLSDRHHVPIRPAPRADRRQPSEDNPLKTPPTPGGGVAWPKRPRGKRDRDHARWKTETLARIGCELPDLADDPDTFTAVGQAIDSGAGTTPEIKRFLSEWWPQLGVMKEAA